MLRVIIIFACLCGPVFADAGEADVTQVVIRQTAPRTYAFDVTVTHADEGWGHYADRWEVVAPDGSVLGTRVLRHPHVTEQPFTRSLTAVPVPDSVDAVTLRAHDSVHAFGGREAVVQIPR